MRKARSLPPLLCTALLVVPALGRAQAIAPANAPGTSSVISQESPDTGTQPWLAIRAGDGALIRFGILFQPQADWSQDPVSGKYAQNLVLRRAQVLMVGQIQSTVCFVFQLADSRLGYSSGGNKIISSGLQMIDAAAGWRITKEFNLWAGLIPVPTGREALKREASEFPLDFSAYAFSATTALAGTAGRDTGFLARGYLAGDRLEYRAGAFQGLRDANSRNAFRYVGRLQYEFFDTEVYGDVSRYPGSYLGAKRVLAAGLAGDIQQKYLGYTADVFADIPTSFGSVVGTTTYQHLDGGKTLTAMLPKSDSFQIEFGVYVKALKAGPWARFEKKSYADPTQSNEHRTAAGLSYFVRGNTVNVKAGYSRVERRSGRGTNEFTFQLQGSYY